MVEQYILRFMYVFMPYYVNTLLMCDWSKRVEVSAADASPYWLIVSEGVNGIALDIHPILLRLWRYFEWVPVDIT